MSKADFSTWHVVRTNPCCEERARASLMREGFGAYLPMARTERQHRRTKAWQQMVRPLMPGYLFADLGTAPNWIVLRRCNGVRSVLGQWVAGELVPWQLSAGQVERIMAAQLNLEFDDTREARARRKETIPDRYPVGGKLIIRNGVFSDWQAEITGATKRGAIAATIEMFGRMVPIELEPADVELRIAA